MKHTNFFLLTLLLGLLTIGSTSAWGAYTGDLYLIGGDCVSMGWNLGNAWHLKHIGNGVYICSGTINNATGSDGFKFVTSNGSWDTQYAPAATTTTLSDNSGGNVFALSGTMTLGIKRNNEYSGDRKWQISSGGGRVFIVVDLSDDNNKTMTIQRVPSKTPYQPYIVGPGASTEWNTNGNANSALPMNFARDGGNVYFWRKVTFVQNQDFKFLCSNAFGPLWGPSENLNNWKATLNVPNGTGLSLGYSGNDNEGDRKFTPQSSGTYNVVLDFMVGQDGTPKMYVYPSDKIYLDMGGTLYDMAWNESTGNYSCSTEIPASTTFRFCMNSNGTGTFGAASANTEIGAAVNDNAKIVRNGTNYYTTPNNKKITGLTLHLATRQLTITSVANDTPAEPEPEPERVISDDYHMRGDLWVTNDNGDWAGTSNRGMLPKPYKEIDGTTYTFSYIAPVANKNRFAIQDKAGSAGDGYTASLASGSSSGITTPSNKEKYAFDVTGSPKQVTVTFYSSNSPKNAKVVLSDYTPNTEGWYFKCESAIGGVAANTNTAMASDGTLTLTNVAAGTYNFYIHDNASELYWGVNKFGGCYVDQTSTASLISSLTTDKKFDSKQWPIMSVSDRKVKMVVGDGDAGKNIRVSFDGGKIVLTAFVPATTVTYTGKEYLFLSKIQKKNNNEGDPIFDFTNSSAHIFVYFWNSETSANGWSDEAFMWDSGDNVLAAKVPAGTWTNCLILRKDAVNNQKNWDNEWNRSYELTVEPGKNYLQTGEDDVWNVYTPPFYLTGVASLLGGSWDGWPYGGLNNTVYNGSATLTNIPAGTYQFKLNPTKDYSSNWAHQINYNHIASTGSNVELTSPEDNQIQFTLSEASSDVTIAYDGNGVTVNAVAAAPEELSGDYYVFGAGGTNWVTGWTRNVEANKMTIADGVATKTFYNVSGSDMEFKIHKGETEYKNDLLLAEVAENNSHLIKKVWKNGTNIDFSISNINVTHKADVTVHFDGAHIWLTAVPHPETVAGSDWYIMGSGNVGTEHNLDWGKGTQKGRGNEHKMTVQDGVASITYTGVSGNIAFKVFRGSDEYEINDFYYDASASSGVVFVDQDGDDNINKSGLSNAAFKISWDGTKIWTTELSTHTVTFNSDGGSAVATQNIVHGEKAIKPANPTKGGYTFNYWKLSGESTEFDFDNTTITANITLIADWSVKPAIHYDGSEYIFWSTHAPTADWGTIVASQDRTMWLRFKNTTTNAVSKTQHAAFLVEGSEADASPWGILAAKVPAGDWHQVQVLRVNAGDNWNGSNNISNEWSWFDLEDGKNYLPQRDWGGSRWSEYDLTGKASFFLSGTNNLTGVSDWTWNGNGTKYVASVTKTLAPATYKFKLTRDRTIYRSCGDYNSLQWVEEGNYDNYDGEHSNVTCTNPDNKQIAFTLSRTSVVTIAWENYDKITVNAVQYPRVTFKDGENTVSFVDVEPGHNVSPAAAPSKANYTFNYWKLEGESTEFDFDNTTITSDITLVADWTYSPAHVSSVSVSQAAIYTWENDVTYTLVGSVDPADIDGATFSWHSDDQSVVTVENGVITVVAHGTANVTFKARDYYNTEKTATCVVTVAPCEKTVADAPKYSATITGYNTVEGTATLSGLWNESSDNTEPAILEKVKIEYKDNNGNNQTPIAVDAERRVKAISGLTDGSDYWYRIPTGEEITNGDHKYAVYYLKNVKTKEYMYADKSTEYGQNGDYWHYWATRTSETNAKTNVYKWFTAINYGQGDHRNVIVCKDGFNNTYTGDGARSNIGLYRTEVAPSDAWKDPYIKCGQKVMNGYQNAHTGMVPSVTSENVENLDYKYSQVNTSYYRMNTGATVTANCGALAELDVIRVALYADAATTVTLEKTDGTVVRTINLAAEAEKDFTYTLTDGSPLVGETAFVIKAVDNHAAIRSVAVTSLVAANPATPELHWSADLSEGVARLLLDGNFTYTASSNDSQGTISYSAEGATVNATTGEVTPPVAAGSATISATITADECHAARTISYNVSFLGLQDYINEESVSSVTLPGDFTGEDLVVNKALTIDGNGHSIGNLTVENSGDLTLSGNLTVNDFTICAKAGNSEHQAESGQVRNANYLTANGNAYFLYTVDPSGQVQYGWYDFTVPFPVNVMTGIKGIQNEVLNEDFQNEVDYAVMEFLGDKLAEGQYSYKKFRGVMQPNKLYSITLDASANYNTVRFQKTADGALVASQSVTLEEHTAASDTRANWNGIGNGTLQHANADVVAQQIQVYRDMTYVAFDKNECSLAVGTAIMVQATGTMTLNSASHGLFAPKRAASIPATTIQIAPEGKPFSDQLFISADETSGQSYTQGVDVAKAGSFGKARVPQIGTNAYNTLLCAHEAQLIDGQAQYALSLYAPANGTYTLTSNVSEDQYLFLTQNGRIIWNLIAPYTLDLTKGTTTEYGLLLVENYKVPTGVENIQGDNVQCTKVLRNGVLYIINNGKVFNAQGANVQ